jgi:hypothetical protein
MLMIDYIECWIKEKCMNLLLLFRRRTLDGYWAWTAIKTSFVIVVDARDGWMDGELIDKN